MKLFLLWMVTMMIAFTLYAADLAGQWKGSMETQQGTHEVTIAVQPGNSLAGKITIGDYESALENGKVDGNKISFEATFSVGKLVGEGTVTGDVMNLTITGTQGNKYTLICKRQK